MDVQVVGAAAAAPQQSPPAPAQGGDIAPQGALPQGALPQGALPQGQGTPSQSSGGLSPIIAKLFDKAVGHSVSVNVSYRIAHDPNMIVTILTDPVTGQEIAQIPPEVMVQIAQFFDKHSGVTLDRSA